MKKVYTTPEMAVNTFKNEDIITVSGGIVVDNGNFKLITTKDAKRDNSIEF